MYILLNESGNIITSIPHTDQPIRQGNDFDLHICFPHEKNFRNVFPFVELSLNGKFVAAGSVDWSEWGTTITFQRADINEAVFGFVPGQSYYSYHLTVSSIFTQNSGTLPMVISTVIDKVVRQGRAELNVLKTYGSDVEEGINVDNFETLMMQIKKSTDLYTFDGEPIDENAVDLDNAILYCWKTLAFVGGVASLKTSLVSLPTFPNNPGYAAIAIFRNAVKVTLPTIFLAHTENGDDIELKIVGDDDGNVYLLVNKESDLSINEEFFFNGQFMASQTTIQFTDPEEVDNEPYRITRVSATAELAESVGVTYALNPIGDDPELRELAFDFHLPSTNFGGVISEDLTVGGNLEVSGNTTLDYLNVSEIGVGDISSDGTIRTSENVSAREYWISIPEKTIIKLDNSVGALGELQFGIPGGDYSPTFYGSLGIEMWDGRTKEYPTVKFNYYDSEDEYESTTEEQIATQEWADARYLKLAGGTITGDVTVGGNLSLDGSIDLNDHGITNARTIGLRYLNFSSEVTISYSGASGIPSSPVAGCYIDTSGITAFAQGATVPANVLVIQFYH